MALVAAGVVVAMAFDVNALGYFMGTVDHYLYHGVTVPL